MAEEIKYIPYGTEEIDYNQFLQNSANSVQNYINLQPWSQKRKQSFLNAYQDLINRGIIGASNSNGIWNINHNGEQIDLNSLSKVDREMYGEAAYFILQQMSKIPSKLIQLKEPDKSNLQSFDNNYFTSSFNTHLSNLKFGGMNVRTEEDWNVLDERENNGLRGTKNRATVLADLLQSYSDSLEKGKYNFEGSPFKDLNDFKSRVNVAIEALRSNDMQASKEALNRIGLRYDDYLYNGGKDSFKKDDYEGNYEDYYNRYLPQQKEAERNRALLKQQQILEEINKNRYKYYINFGYNMNGTPPTGSDALTKLNNYATKKSLNGLERSEIVGAFKFALKKGLLLNLSKEELQKFDKTYSNHPARLKKIEGLNGFYWDSIGDRVVQPLMEKPVTTNSFLSIIDLNSPEAKKAALLKAQEAYLQNTEWTNDLWRELGGIAADVASVIDPEPLSAGALALTGSGLRTYNRFTDDNGITLGDIGNTALDVGLSAFGMIPVVGDAALGVRIVNKLLKAAGWLGGLFALGSVPQAAKAAWNKVVNGQDMTVDDWRAIGNVLMGVTLARRILLNRAAGNVVKNSTAGTRTEKVGEVEVKINGKTEKVEIDEQAAKELQQAYKAAGKDVNKTSEALRNSKAVRQKLEAKKGSDGKPVYTKEQIDAMEAPRAASGSIRGRVPGAHDTRGIKINTKTIQVEGTPIPEDTYRRVKYMMNDEGSLWKLNYKRGNFGWNINRGTPSNNSWIKDAWLRFKNPYAPRTNRQSSTTLLTTLLTTTNLNSFTNVDLRNQRMVENTLNPSRRKLTRETKTIKVGETLKATLQDGKEYNFKYEKTGGNNIITITGNGVNEKESFKTLKESKEFIAKFIREQNAKVTQGVNGARTQLSPEFIKSIRDLKRKGFLYKQGGTLDKTLSDFLNNNKI